MTTSAVARRAPGEALPVLVLTGFLGAGKTTLLNYLLSGLSGARVAAVVNDFGAVEVDALNIASRVDSTISLAGGCMCCEIDVSEVDTALADLASPERELDLVVIEASGLAEPDVLAGMVRGQPRTEIAYAGLINVVDAVHFPQALDQHPQLGKHLGISDLLVVTKSDLLDDGDREEFLRFLRGRAPLQPICVAKHGRVDVRLLFGDGRERAATSASDVAHSGASVKHAHGGQVSVKHGHEHAEPHIHEGYESTVATPGGPLHPRRFYDAVSNMPGGVFRAKGRIVLASEDGPWVYRLNVVGDMLDLESEGPAASDARTEVVLIGIDLGSAAASFLDPAVADRGEHVVAEDRFALEPYLVAPPDAEDATGWIYEEERHAPLTSHARMLYDPDDPEAEDPTQTP